MVYQRSSSRCRFWSPAEERPQLPTLHLLRSNTPRARSGTWFVAGSKGRSLDFSAPGADPRQRPLKVFPPLDRSTCGCASARRSRHPRTSAESSKTSQPLRKPTATNVMDAIWRRLMLCSLAQRSGCFRQILQATCRPFVSVKVALRVRNHTLSAVRSAVRVPIVPAFAHVRLPRAVR